MLIGGEIKVLLFNHSDIDFPVFPGDRICQIVFEKIVTDVNFSVVNHDLSKTDRDRDRFGSYGFNIGSVKFCFSF